MTEPHTPASEGALLWEPGLGRSAASRLSHFMRWLGHERGQAFADYDQLWAYSVTELQAFWCSVARYFEVELHGQIEPALLGKTI